MQASPRQRMPAILWTAGLLLLSLGNFAAHPLRAAPAPVADLLKLTEEWNRSWLAPERAAQRCENVVIWWWDQSRIVPNAWDVLAGLEIPEVRLPEPSGPTEPLADGCYRRALVPAGSDLEAGGLRAAIRKWERAGWKVAQSEWRLVRFEPDSAGPRSRLWTEFHLQHAESQRRVILRGHWALIWEPLPAGEGAPKPRSLRWESGELLWRDGPPRFALEAEFSLKPASTSRPDIFPLLISDLEGDGREEVVLLGANRRLNRSAAGKWTEAPLLDREQIALGPGLLADFTGDGRNDLLSTASGSLIVFPGLPGGTFEIPPLPTPLPDLRLPSGVASADVDGDGDLDVFVGQYLSPNGDRRFPVPFDNSNNGLRSYLLRNDGQGNFTNITVGSGLDRHLWRRNYTACFLDFDGDGQSDFAQVNDFAGLDFYLGSGGGKFREATAELLGEARGFGMAHLVGDFDGDGRPDLFMLGMNAVAADRMEHLQLGPPGFERTTAGRAPMVAGNRLWLNRGTNRWEIPGWAPQLARTGWTWGATQLDADNDGREELYVANGFLSGLSATDWDNEFWCSLMYFWEVGTPDAWEKFRAARLGGADPSRTSWGGNYRNQLLTPGPDGWRDLAWLAGVALPEDSRCVSAQDLDGDGRQDLVVTTAELWPAERHRVLIFRNQAPAAPWLEVQVAGEKGRAPWGARVSLELAGGRRQHRWLLDHSGFQTQPAPVAHFGLGAETNLLSVEVRWPDGTTRRIERPTADQRLVIPATASPPGR